MSKETYSSVKWDLCVCQKRHIFQPQKAYVRLVSSNTWGPLDMCCSVLQCVAACCSVLQCVAVCCSVLQCVAACCSVLQCVAVCNTSFTFAVRIMRCSVLGYLYVYMHIKMRPYMTYRRLIEFVEASKEARVRAIHMWIFICLYSYRYSYVYIHVDIHMSIFI